MNTCFLFTKSLDEDGCMCLLINEAGDIIEALEQRGFEKIQQLQANCRTLVVESSENTSLQELALPLLPERKARTVIPFALEDKLAQSIDELHFCYDKQRYHNKHYLITVISKLRMRFLMDTLSKHGIRYELITTDWFALTAEEVVISDGVALIHSQEFKGNLAGDLALSFLHNHPQLEPLVFQDSTLALEQESTQHEVHSYVWMARQLVNTNPLNLCQGEMQQGTESNWIKKGYQLAGILGCVWLVSLLLFNSLNLFALNKQTKAVDQQIAVIYNKFFPEAKQVISPKFRISQLLSANNVSESRFWFLLNQFARGMDRTLVNVEQLQYQNKILTVTLVSPDFQKLEQLENKLKSYQLLVKQTQAATNNQQVVATLELS